MPISVSLNEKDTEREIYFCQKYQMSLLFVFVKDLSGDVGGAPSVGSGVQVWGVRGPGVWGQGPKVWVRAPNVGVSAPSVRAKALGVGSKPGVWSRPQSVGSRVQVWGWAPSVDGSSTRQFPLLVSAAC